MFFLSECEGIVTNKSTSLEPELFSLVPWEQAEPYCPAARVGFSKRSGTLVIVASYESQLRIPDPATVREACAVIIA